MQILVVSLLINLKMLLAIINRAYLGPNIQVHQVSHKYRVCNEAAPPSVQRAQQEGLGVRGPEEGPDQVIHDVVAGLAELSEVVQE